MFNIELDEKKQINKKYFLKSMVLDSIILV